MSMDKRNRRRMSAQYSHSEPIMLFERDKETGKIIRSSVVGYTDMRGDGRTMSNRSTPPYEVKIQRSLVPPPRERHDRDDTED